MNKYNVMISQGSHNNIMIPNVKANTEKEALKEAIGIIKENKFLKHSLPGFPEKFAKVNKLIKR